jgi:hypothetical protein
VETARIPNYGEHHLLGLDSVPLAFRNLCIRLRPHELMVCVQVKIMTRRGSQCRAKIAAHAVPALKKVVVTTSLDRAFDSVTKNGIPTGDGAHETVEIALIVCGQSFLVGVRVVITRELMQNIGQLVSGG